MATRLTAWLQWRVIKKYRRRQAWKRVKLWRRNTSKTEFVATLRRRRTTLTTRQLTSGASTLIPSTTVHNLSVWRWTTTFQFKTNHRNQSFSRAKFDNENDELAEILFKSFACSEVEYSNAVFALLPPLVSTADRLGDFPPCRYSTNSEYAMNTITLLWFSTSNGIGFPCDSEYDKNCIRLWTGYNVIVRVQVSPIKSRFCQRLADTFFYSAE